MFCPYFRITTKNIAKLNSISWSFINKHKQNINFATSWLICDLELGQRCCFYITFLSQPTLGTIFHSLFLKYETTSKIEIKPINVVMFQHPLSIEDVLSDFLHDNISRWGMLQLLSIKSSSISNCHYFKAYQTSLFQI